MKKAKHSLFLITILFPWSFIFIYISYGKEKTIAYFKDILNLDEKEFVDSIVRINNELQWMNPSNRGYLSLNCRKDKIIASFNFIKELEQINSDIGSSKSFVLHQKDLELEEIKA